jgi:nucleoside-diphosphate-sugar epimerase
MNGGPILVKGDGTPYRSYLYAADLAIWLWTVLFRGESCRPYNVGSEHDLCIASLAELIAGLVPRVSGVQIARQPVPGIPAERYVPSVQRAQNELDLQVWVGLLPAMRRTLEWQSS